jgi:hypothetical protein
MRRGKRTPLRAGTFPKMREAGTWRSPFAPTWNADLERLLGTLTWDFDSF